MFRALSQSFWYKSASNQSDARNYCPKNWRSACEPRGLRVKQWKNTLNKAAFNYQITPLPNSPKFLSKLTDKQSI